MCDVEEGSVSAMEEFDSDISSSPGKCRKFCWALGDVGSALEAFLLCFEALGGVFAGSLLPESLRAFLELLRRVDAIPIVGGGALGPNEQSIYAAVRL